MKNLLQKTALVVASLAVALGLAEAIVRLGGLAPAVVRLERDGYRLSDNTRLAYEPVPGFDGRNSMGFRDREHEAVKPDEVYRILVLGDSIAEGFGGIQAEAIFTARLQASPLLFLGRQTPAELVRHNKEIVIGRRQKRMIDFN